MHHKPLSTPTDLSPFLKPWLSELQVPQKDSGVSDFSEDLYPKDPEMKEESPKDPRTKGKEMLSSLCTPNNHVNLPES